MFKLPTPRTPLLQCQWWCSLAVDQYRGTSHPHRPAPYHQFYCLHAYAFTYTHAHSLTKLPSSFFPLNTPFNFLLLYHDAYLFLFFPSCERLFTSPSCLFHLSIFKSTCNHPLLYTKTCIKYWNFFYTSKLDRVFVCKSVIVKLWHSYSRLLNFFPCLIIVFLHYLVL